MDARKLSILTWFLALVMALDAQVINCKSSSPSTTGASPTNLILSQGSYQTHVEVKILDKNYSMTLDEYLDYDRNAARLIIYKGGVTENLIFSYDTGEVFDIKNQSCKVYPVNNNPYTFLFGPFGNSTSGLDKRHIFGAGASLRFAGDNQTVYNGTGSVRGIPADIWTACLSWPGASGNIKATYYFSRLGWNMSSPQQQVPLRTELEGSLTFSSNGAGRYIHHIYDFIGYLPYVKDSDPSIFLTPPQVICLGRNHTKNLPSVPNSFRYKAEIVDSIDSYITYYAMWYDQNYRMVREDTRKILPSSGSEATIVNTTTEIHDFNTGVQYILDSNTGCTIKPIDPGEADTKADVARFSFNGTLVVDMRDPSSFFVLNNNYTYSGQRTVRGVTCDVYSAAIPGYQLQGNTVNAVYEYLFLADGWSDLPLFAPETNVQNYPVQLVISVPSAQYTRIYNFFEFVEGPLTYPTFDISSCFDDSQKLGLQLTFPGSLGAGLEEEWTLLAYDALITAMQIFPIRVGGITITNDDDNVYVNAYVMTSSISAQFEKTKISLERKNDKMIKGITTSDECAAKCVDNTDFTCEGFQYCPDDGFACLLSKTHSARNNVTRNATACDEFKRTVKIGTMREPLLKEAYSSLESVVNQGSFQIHITDNQGNSQAPFIALDVQQTSGKVIPSKPLPSLPSAFSYRMETVVASSKTVKETYIWYDQNMSLVRYDQRDPTDISPYMTTYIHDFNLGVAYQIDQVTEECTVTHISSSGVFDVNTDTVSTARSGGLVLTMKTPYALFFLDDSYIYVGQTTARGILCDVYESRRGDFDFEYFNKSSTDTVFKYYFQASTWTYTSPYSTISTFSQPVQLNIEDKSNEAFVTYNFYDFTEQHFPATVYDTSACYSSDEKKNFVLIFKNQPFHPLLDGLSNVFIESAVDKLAETTFLSLINFQHVTVTYDDNDVYLTVTALGHTSLINLFTPVMKVTHNATAIQISALSSSDCAAACVMSTTFICNSFDYCDDPSSSNCLLGTKHTETEGDPLDFSGPCTHFSRTENGTYPGMSIQKMYDTVVNLVYDQKFKIGVTLLNGTTVTYIATDIRDDILQPNDAGGTAGAYLNKFVIIPRYQFKNQSLVAVKHSAVSITDCAMYCIQENTFECQAFDYQFSLGDCRLSNVHPDEIIDTNQAISPNEYSSIYSRLYTADYIKSDIEMFGTHPDKTILNIKSDELCARTCTDNVDFVCEAFEICNDGSCQLRKNHIIEIGNATQNHSCVHYSRNHLYDYVRRDNKIITTTGYANSTVDVDNPSVCAQLCGTGDGLPSCASFEICQPQEGVTRCTLSTADPTTQKNITIDDSMQCTLYTRANPISSSVNPTINQRAQALIPRKLINGPSIPVKPESAGLVAPVKPTTDQCVGQSGASINIGARVGIAFGTLILGLLLGAACTFLFMRYRFGRHGDQEGGNVLKTWDS